MHVVKPIAMPPQDASDASTPVVILLHGLWRTKHSMQPLARHIQEKTGFKAYSIGYHTTKSLRDLAVSTAEDVVAVAGPARPVYAVTHSMGAIVLRHIMELPSQGGVQWAGCCMLAPPNHGSSIARVFNKWHITRTVFRWTTGKAGAALADELSECSRWAPPPLPCGIIAGTASLALANPTSWMTKTLGLHGKRASDGTVAVGETLLDDMTDFTLVHADHTFIMRYSQVQMLVVRFLQHHSFGEWSMLDQVEKYKAQLAELHAPDAEAKL